MGREDGGWNRSYTQSYTQSYTHMMLCIVYVVYLETSKELVAKEPDNFDSLVESNGALHPAEDGVMNAEQRHQHQRRFGPFSLPNVQHNMRNYACCLTVITFMTVCSRR